MARVKNVFCYNCGAEFGFAKPMFACPKCEYSLDIAYNYREVAKAIRRHKRKFLAQAPSHWKYWMFYPVKESGAVTLGEGGTPLVKSMKHEGLLFKYEATNPTGSFKDRGSAVEVSRALELGIREVLCASTGNMGASVAAYCSRYGIKASVYVPRKLTPKEKVSQIRAYGATVERVSGTYERAVMLTKDLRLKTGVYLMGDYPTRGEGEKSVGFEIADQLKWKVPDNIIAPIGNGTLIYAINKAMVEMKVVGLIRRIPKLIGVQAEGCNPVYEAFRKGLDYVPVVKSPKTIATAIACGYPVDGRQALDAVINSKGKVLQVSDRKIMHARVELAREGLYAEPGGAVAYAGFKKEMPEGKTVCIVTGHGLKEPMK